MQTVSQEWKNAHNETLLPEGYVEVTLLWEDPIARSDANVIDNGSVHFANAAHTVSEVDKTAPHYTTLEQNLWLLNGDMEVLPDSNYKQVGYVSNVMSGSNGVFSSKPIVTINFTEVHSDLIPGITVTWGTAYDDYATDFTVSAYNGDTVVATKSVNDNTSVTSPILFDIVNYDRITITINKWCSPYRRARIADICIGLKQIYTKSEITSFKHSQTIDLTSCELPKAYVEFSVIDFENEYNPDNSNNISRYLIRGEELKARYGYKIGKDVEWIDCGVFYLSEWSHKPNSNSVSFTARDGLEYMTKEYSNAHTYNISGVSLYDLAEEVLTFANLPLQSDGTVRWVIDERLKDVYTKAVLPTDTIANCLQLIANAGCCVLYQDRQGVIHIERQDNILDDYSITPDNSFTKPEKTAPNICNRVNVAIYEYTVSDTEITAFYKSFKKPTSNDNLSMSIYGKYKEPVVNLRYTNSAKVAVDRIRIGHESFEADVTLAEPSSVWAATLAIYGYPYESAVASNVIVNVGGEGDEIMVDNPLITSEEMALAVGEWIKEHQLHNTSVTYDWRCDPRLDCLDVITGRDDIGDKNVIMTNVEYAFNGAFKGSAEGRVL